MSFRGHQMLVLWLFQWKQRMFFFFRNSNMTISPFKPSKRLIFQVNKIPSNMSKIFPPHKWCTHFFSRILPSLKSQPQCWPGSNLFRGAPFGARCPGFFCCFGCGKKNRFERNFCEAPQYDSMIIWLHYHHCLPFSQLVIVKYYWYWFILSRDVTLKRRLFLTWLFQGFFRYFFYQLKRIINARNLVEKFDDLDAGSYWIWIRSSEKSPNFQGGKSNPHFQSPDRWFALFVVCSCDPSGYNRSESKSPLWMISSGAAEWTQKTE